MQRANEPANVHRKVLRFVVRHVRFLRSGALPVVVGKAIPGFLVALGRQKHAIPLPGRFNTMQVIDPERSVG